MTDAHCHLSSEDPAVRELLIGRDFVGIHPWSTLDQDEAALRSTLNTYCLSLNANPRIGIGEIGLDRLKVRATTPLMRELFEAQFKLAVELRRPVVLHGAKCWGEVVKTVKSITTSARDLPPMLFHGFSRSDGLIPDIVRMGGFISVGPAVLNDHAVNYRELVKKLPLENLLLETDRTESGGPSLRDVLLKTADICGVSAAELETITDANATRFLI